jgi:hypothetical protein
MILRMKFGVALVAPMPRKYSTAARMSNNR